jgi:PiT family inorganic phosphate transporter
MDVSAIVVVGVLTVLVFDFTNGFHDTANAMATSITTGALRAQGRSHGSRLFEPDRRLPVDRGNEDDLGRLVDETLITPVVIFAGLVEAIFWNLVTWFGLPSSSSHALFGGVSVGSWFVTWGDGSCARICHCSRCIVRRVPIVAPGQVRRLPRIERSARGSGL